MALFFPQVNIFSIERYASILGPERMQAVAVRVAQLRTLLSGRVIWNISSSHSGGGVAEMVRSLLAYARGAGVDARWAVIQGSPEFFRVTKRIHNAIHGSAGDLSSLGDRERKVYEQANREWAEEFLPMLRPSDVVIVHDPQPAGLIPALKNSGTHVIWRCHIGTDQCNLETARGWNFLLPYVKQASAFVFSRSSYIPSELEMSRATVIPPSLDPFSSKNEELSERRVHSILLHAGLIGGPAIGELPVFTREDGTPGRVDRFADMVTVGKLPVFETPIVTQVSRWDRLKDAQGVMQGFARAEGGSVTQSHLILAGPSTRSVRDDPEDTEIFRGIVEAWRALPEGQRVRVHLASIPTEDIEENAAIINALQRHASVVVQKSLQEGFGLTVMEALWKSRAVIASEVGGIQDQIENGVQGLLLSDPSDLSSFGDLLEKLLSDSVLRERLGRQGRDRVVERYLGIESLLRYGALIESIDSHERNESPHRTSNKSA
jgi:trehalose synthase